jgi:DNA (cytosine-5)-methyltransferase 1
MRPRLLDLFCKAGGAGKGYHNAGFDVVGVDIEPQPNYPFEFHCADALTFPLDNFDAIHASPPCQAHSRAQKIRGRDHPELIAATRARLLAAEVPYIIENVPSAPLINPVVLEGQMFDGLRTQRTRWFETNWPLDVPFMRSPRPAPNAKMGRRVKAGEWMHVVGNFTDPVAGGEAMGIGWMTRAELAQAIPPAYTEMIGEQLMAYLKTRRAA